LQAGKTSTLSITTPKLINYTLITNIMAIDKTVKRLALAIGIPVAGYTALLAGYNFYAHNNHIYEIGDKKVFQKMDGIASYTALEISKEDSSFDVKRYSPFGYRRYKDDDGNGIVDELYLEPNPFTRNSRPKVLERNRHMKKYQSVFQKADRDYRQQIKRFKIFMNR
jgi:hypothetical protein